MKNPVSREKALSKGLNGSFALKVQISFHTRPRRRLFMAG